MTRESRPRNPHIEAAIRICGGRQEDLARATGLRQQRVSKLLRGEIPISESDAILIHRATAGQVPGSLTRPDLWRKPEHVPVPESRPAAIEGVRP